MGGGVQMGLRNEAFKSKLALTYAELYDGIRPARKRVSLRIKDDVLELKDVQTQDVTLWRLSQMREVTDQADEDALTFAADNYDPARLVVREVEAIKALAQTGEKFEPFSGPRGQLVRLAIVGVFSALGIWGLLFGLVPWFANQASVRVSPAAAATIGERAFQDFYIANGATECTNFEGTAALALMSSRLTESATLATPLRIRVVDDPTTNATAAPGGVITIHQGLLEFAESPEEIAAVLAHEIGHVANNDGLRLHLQYLGSYSLVNVVMGDVFGLAGSHFANYLLQASYSREAEAAADAYAHNMMVQAGLPPEALATLFSRFREELGDEADLNALRHLSTHPELLDRIEAAAAAGAAASAGGPPVLSAEQWAALQDICAKPESLEDEASNG